MTKGERIFLAIAGLMFVAIVSQTIDFETFDFDPPLESVRYSRIAEAHQ